MFELKENRAGVVLNDLHNVIPAASVCELTVRGSGKRVLQSKTHMDPAILSFVSLSMRDDDENRQKGPKCPERMGLACKREVVQRRNYGVDGINIGNKSYKVKGYFLFL